MKTEKTHKRFIKCSQKLTYYQEVELTTEQLNLLENVDGEDVPQRSSNEAYHLIQGLIDPYNVFDEEQEYADFELLKK